MNVFLRGLVLGLGLGSYPLVCWDRVVVLPPALGSRLPIRNRVSTPLTLCLSSPRRGPVHRCTTRPFSRVKRVDLKSLRQAPCPDTIPSTPVSTLPSGPGGQRSPIPPSLVGSPGRDRKTRPETTDGVPSRVSDVRSGKVSVTMPLCYLPVTHYFLRV